MSRLVILLVPALLIVLVTVNCSYTPRYLGGRLFIQVTMQDPSQYDDVTIEWSGRLINPFPIPEGITVGGESDVPRRPVQNIAWTQEPFAGPYQITRKWTEVFLLPGEWEFEIDVTGTGPDSVSASATCRQWVHVATDGGNSFHVLDTMLDISEGGGNCPSEFNYVYATGTVAIETRTIGGDEAFDFTTDLPGGDFQITTAGGSGSQTYADPIRRGTYEVTQNAPPGWVTSSDCVDSVIGGTPSVASGTAATINLNPNETVTCTFTNIRGLIAAYAFDEGSGTTVADSSGNGHTGVINGATWTTGRFGTALFFDGTGVAVQIPDSPSLNVTDSFTVTAWVSRGSTGTWQVVYHNGPADVNWGVYISDEDRMVYSEHPSTDFVAAPNAALTETGKPQHHLAWVKDGWAGSNIRFYLDGVANGSAAAGTATASGDKRIGGDGWGNDDEFNGMIDNVRLYDRALTPAEIQVDLATQID